jgi:hypothetical protein
LCGCDDDGLEEDVIAHHLVQIVVEKALKILAVDAQHALNETIEYEFLLIEA